MKHFTRLSSIIVVVLVAACGSAAQGGSATGSRNLLTDEEIMRVYLPSAYEAVRRYRPQWLRGTLSGPKLQPVVYLNGVRHGDLVSLESIAAETVLDMRYLSGRDATTRYGTGHTGGVILVRTKTSQN